MRSDSASISVAASAAIQEAFGRQSLQRFSEHFGGNFCSDSASILAAITAASISVATSAAIQSECAEDTLQEQQLVLR